MVLETAAHLAKLGLFWSPALTVSPSQTPGPLLCPVVPGTWGAPGREAMGQGMGDGGWGWCSPGLQGGRVRPQQAEVALRRVGPGCAVLCVLLAAPHPKSELVWSWGAPWQVHPHPADPHLRFPTRPCSSRCSRALSRRRLSSLVKVPSECRGALRRGRGGGRGGWSGPGRGGGGRARGPGPRAHLGGAGRAAQPRSSGGGSSSSSSSRARVAMVGAGRGLSGRGAAAPL